MTMMTLSLSDTLQSFVDEQASAGAFGTGSDYVRELISRDRDRQILRRKVLDGMESPLGPPADDAYFEALRERIRNHAAG